MLNLLKTKSQFGRNILISSRANLIALVLPVLITPILTRLYTSDDFATVAVFSSVLSILAAFCSWRLDWHIPTASSYQQALALFFIGMLLSILVSVGIFLLLNIAPMILEFWQGWTIIEPYSSWLPVALIGITLSSFLRALYIKEANLTSPSRTRIFEVLSNSLLQTLAGLTKQGALGLIASRVLSTWIGALVLLAYSKHFFLKVRNLSLMRVYASWLIHYRVSSASTAVSIVNVISLSILPLLLIQYYSAKEVGWFTLMFRLAVAPIGVVTSAVGQSFWAEAATLIKHNKVQLYSLYMLNTKRLILLSAPVAIMCLLGPYYVGWLLGEDEWSGAGYLLASLTPMIVGQVVFSPLSHLIIHNKQHWQLTWDSIRLLLIGGVPIFFHDHLTITELLWLISCISLFMYVILFYLNKMNFGEINE